MPWKKQFDVDEALQKAGETFWSHGYEATSLQDLLRSMGIQKGSFYDTYGSKRDAYLKALDQYATGHFEAFRAAVAGLDPLSALRRAHESILAECLAPEGHRGCMVINCALELGHEDDDARAIVHRSLADYEGLFAEWIRAGRDRGDIDARVDPEATAKAMLAIVIGMRVQARSGADPETLRTLSRQALALVTP